MSMQDGCIDLIESILAENGIVANFKIPGLYPEEDLGFSDLIDKLERIEIENPNLSEDELFEKVIENVPELFDTISTDELIGIIESLIANTSNLTA